jgi:hypothetical protein
MGCFWGGLGIMLRIFGMWLLRLEVMLLRKHQMLDIWFKKGGI